MLSALKVDDAVPPQLEAWETRSPGTGLRLGSTDPLIGPGSESRRSIWALNPDWPDVCKIGVRVTLVIEIRAGIARTAESIRRRNFVVVIPSAGCRHASGAR
jgi:hypothetical protein